MPRTVSVAPRDTKGDAGERREHHARGEAHEERSWTRPAESDPFQELAPMSHPDLAYPPPRYLGEPGLTNARLRPTDQEPEIRYASGGAVRYLATGESTGGQFGLYRWEMAAAPSGPDPHFHRTISESFYVLSGTIRLYDGRDWLDGRPGDFVFVPEVVFTGSRTSP